MRSLLRRCRSLRKPYWRPLYGAVRFDVPVSSIGMPQGMLNVAAVPQDVPKYCWAVWATPEADTPTRPLWVRIFVPRLLEKFWVAHDLNSGDSNVWTVLPPERVRHKDST